MSYEIYYAVFGHSSRSSVWTYIIFIDEMSFELLLIKISF